MTYFCYNPDLNEIFVRFYMTPKDYVWYCLPSRSVFMVPTFDYNSPHEEH